MTYVVIAIYRLVEFWRINMTKGSYSGVRCEWRAAYSEPGQMDQIAVITLWMLATQIGHAFANQMYGCVDWKTSNGFGNANAIAMSANAAMRVQRPR